jgi:DNA repair exonuclease SbcCD ATPase subunit
MTHQNLLTWADKQLAWARDALRRHALAPNFELNDEDKSAVIKRVRSAAGIGDNQGCDNTPFTGADLHGGSTTGPRTILVSLGSVKNLARLAANQTLSFAIDGITLIYGDNGTGKSGYCRITKKLCRSLTSEDLLGDVFTDGAKPPAEVSVRYLCDGETTPQAELWHDGTPPPAAIANISVFDSRNARLYVDEENKIGFLPREVALLEQYAQHCGEMDETFSGEQKALNARVKVPLPAGYSPNGVVSKLFLRLQPKIALPTADEIRTAASWTDADQQELDALEKALAQDPKALADRYRRATSVLKAYLPELQSIETVLSDETAAKLTTLSGQARATATAAALAASEKFKDEPVPGVGLPPWRLMYDYARDYVKSVNADLEALPTNEGDPCALCQQPLSADGSARMQRFAEFVNDQASKAADAARLALQGGIKVLQALNVPKRKDVEHALADYRKLTETAEQIAVAIIDYLEKAEERRLTLVDAANTGSFEKVGALSESIAAKLTDEIAALELAASEYDKATATDSAQRTADRARLAELKDRKKLSEDLDTVLARLVDLEMLAKLAKCRDLVSTKQASLQITSLRRELVTVDLEKRIIAEIESFDLTHLPFRVSDRSSGGQSYFAVALKTPVGVANDKVLSEGEQRALALACFLGELGADTFKHGLVIDDPVSSLDHIRIRRVARRLVAEAAKGKQVIVFTHNLLFYNEVAEAAAQSTPQIPVAKRIVTKSTAAGFGIISDTDEPWIAQKVNERILRLRAHLKKIETRTDFESDEYRGLAKDFYTDLRETWERLVEEVLLGKVVERFNTDIRTQSLKGVVVDDDDYKTIYWAMKHASERSGHDMAAGRNVPVPKPDEMKSDLKTIDDYRTKIDKRRKTTAESRAEYEKAPKAATL